MITSIFFDTIRYQAHSPPPRGVYDASSETSILRYIASFDKISNKIVVISSIHRCSVRESARTHLRGDLSNYRKFRYDIPQTQPRLLTLLGHIIRRTRAPWESAITQLGKTYRSIETLDTIYQKHNLGVHDASSLLTLLVLIVPVLRARAKITHTLDDISTYRKFRYDIPKTYLGVHDASSH